MLKKLSAKTNFILIGIIVGLFVGVSIRQALGDTDPSGTVRADNLTVNTGRIAGNGLAVDFGNLLVPNGNIGIGTTTPTTSLDVVGKIKSSQGFCIDEVCVTKDDLKTLLGTVIAGSRSNPDTSETGTYKGYVQNNVLAQTVANMTQANASVACTALKNINLAVASRCTWNDIEILNYTPTGTDNNILHACATGTVWNGVSCQPPCVGLATWNGSGCVIPTCAAGTYRPNAELACTSIPTCATGSTWNGMTCYPDPYFKASRNPINSGDSTTLSWDASSISNYCVIVGVAGQTMISNNVFGGSGSRSYNPTSTTKYTIKCLSNDVPAKVLYQRTQTVVVNP